MADLSRVVKVLSDRSLFQLGLRLARALRGQTFVTYRTLNWINLTREDKTRVREALVALGEPWASSFGDKQEGGFDETGGPK